MNSEEVKKALSEITLETDPCVKHLLLASLISVLFRQQGIELVVVGGSAIEFYTEGAYVSGDLDMCLISPTRLDIRKRQELMGLLLAKGGPRSWQVCGIYVDILGEVETLSGTPFNQLQCHYGTVCLLSPEDLLVERVLISVYPEAYEPARACARKLIAVALEGHIQMDWKSLRSLAERKEYQVFSELKELVQEVSNELQRTSPYDSEG